MANSSSISFGLLTEEDLELQLGPRSVESSDLANQGRTINGIGNLSHDSNHLEKCTRCSSSNQKHPVEVEPKYTCGICLDTLKEEASIKCGHVFCKPCITKAIRIQKRCPTCRTKNSLRSIRRIYLS